MNRVLVGAQYSRGERPGLIFYREGPLYLPRIAIERINVEVVIGDDQGSVGGHRDARLEPIDETFDASGSAFGDGFAPRLPDQAAGFASEGVDPTVAGRDVDSTPIVEERAGIDDITGLVSPLLFPGSREAVEGMVAGTDIDVLVAVDDRATEYAQLGSFFPRPVSGRPRNRRASARLRRVALELGPRT